MPTTIAKTETMSARQIEEARLTGALPSLVRRRKDNRLFAYTDRCYRAESGECRDHMHVLLGLRFGRFVAHMG